MGHGQQDMQHDGNMVSLFEVLLSVLAMQVKRLRRKWMTRRILVTAAILLMSGLLLLAACQAGSNPSTTSSGTSGITSEATMRPNYLNSFTLAQRVAESINQQNQVANIFQSIPDAQRRGLALDDYIQYIRLLRRMANGSIASLTRIGNTELSQLLQGLRFAADLKHEGFYFQAGQSSDPGQRFAYFQQVAEDGTPYLDRVPITRVLALQNYAALYFDAIDRSDRDALAVLIRSMADTQEARLAKADRILAFYRNQVATASPAFRIAMVMPDRLTFVQNVYDSADRSKMTTRRMTIYADGAVGFLIDDPIPDTLKLDDLKISLNSKPMFDFSRLQNGQLPIITSSQLGETVGTALLHNDSTCTRLPNGERQMVAYYNGVIIEGVGQCNEHLYWRMRVTRMTFIDNSFQTGSGFCTSQSINSLLLKYPFLDETNGVVETMLDKYRMKLAFNFDNKTISRITLTVGND